MSGTTADKLNYLKTTKELLRQEINYDFPDLELTTSSAFRQYPSKMDSSQLWMDAWISGGVKLNATYNGTNRFWTGYRTFKNISMPNVTDAYFLEVKADTVTIAGPTNLDAYIFNGGTFNKIYITKLQRIDRNAGDSDLYGGTNSTRVGELHLTSLTLVRGKKGLLFPTNAINENNVFLPRIQTIGAYALKGTNYHIGTELSTVCNLTGSSGVSSVTNIYVPASLVNSYKSATNWSDHADKIKAEPGT